LKLKSERKEKHKNKFKATKNIEKQKVKKLVYVK
jgi:hypothetical protein